MVFFLLGFAFMVFHGTGAVTTALVGLIAAAVSVQVLWAIVTNWESKPPCHQSSEPPYLETGLGDDDEVIDRVYGPAKKGSGDGVSKVNGPRYTALLNRWRNYLVANRTRSQEMVTIDIREPV